MATTETRRMVLAAAEACEDKKAEDTRILELDAVDAGFTDFFLITSGSNERQTQAIADEIEIRLKKDFQTYPNSVEGRRQGEWILMDYVDFVVHIFLRANSQGKVQNWQKNWQNSINCVARPPIKDTTTLNLKASTSCLISLESYKFYNYISKVVICR